MLANVFRSLLGIRTLELPALFQNMMAHEMGPEEMAPLNGYLTRLTPLGTFKEALLLFINKPHLGHYPTQVTVCHLSSGRIEYNVVSWYAAVIALGGTEWCRSHFVCIHESHRPYQKPHEASYD